MRVNRLKASKEDHMICTYELLLRQWIVAKLTFISKTATANYSSYLPSLLYLHLKKKIKAEVPNFCFMQFNHK